MNTNTNFKTRISVFLLIFKMALMPFEKLTTLWNIITTLLIMFAPTILNIRIENHTKIIYNLKWEYQLIYILGIVIVLLFTVACRIQLKIKRYEMMESNLINLNQLRFNGIKIQTKYERLLINKSEFQDGFGFDDEEFDGIKIESTEWMEKVVVYLEENNPAFSGKFEMLGRFSVKDVLLPVMFDKENNIHKEAQDLMYHLAKLDRLDRIIDLLEQQLLSLD